MNVRPIRNDSDHAWALDEVRRLWGAAAGSDEAERLEVLVVLIDAYEAQHHTVPDVDPIEALKFRMEAGGLTPRDLTKWIGSKGRVSEVLNKRRRLTLGMIRRLSSGLAMPIEVLAQEYELDDRRRAG